MSIASENANELSTKVSTYPTKLWS